MKEIDKWINAFADKHENPEPPGSDWDYTLAKQNGPDGYRVAIVSITIYNESLARLEKMIEMGFTEGLKCQ